jgi:uncharacterized protein YkwD
MKLFGGTSAVSLVVALSLASAASASPGTDAVALINATRAQHHLGALHETPLLDRSAAMKAAAIRRCNNFSHTACGTPFTRTFQQTGYFRARAAVGENLYWGTGSYGSPSNALSGWLNSPPHRANLLGRWRDVGIAVVHADTLFGQHDVWLFVAQFGRRR